MPLNPPVSLLLSDVDGTLVNSDKQVTDLTRAAVKKLYQAGIQFAVTSGRPCRGMQMLSHPLSLTTPFAAFNGGQFVQQDMTLLEQHILPADVSRQMIPLLEKHELDIWIYREDKWYVQKLDAPHVARERNTVQFAPTLVSNFDNYLEGAVKIVGVSDDLEAVKRCELEAQNILGHHLSAARSQPYYLDITHPKANKGNVVLWLSHRFGIPVEQIAAIGDGMNDTLMFAQSGISIAMGNSSPEVQSKAKYVTSGNDKEGFSEAVSKYILQ